MQIGMIPHCLMFAANDLVRRGSASITSNELGAACSLQDLLAAGEDGTDILVLHQSSYFS